MDECNTVWIFGTTKPFQKYNSEKIGDFSHFKNTEKKLKFEPN